MVNTTSSKYNELVEIVQSVESYSSSQEKPVIIDLEKILNQKPIQIEKRYSDLLEYIENVEGKQKPKVWQKEKEQKISKEHIMVAGVEQMKYSNPTPSFVRKEEEAAKTELKAIKEKLSEITPKIRELKELRRQRLKPSDLILPSLSLTDQISELERIIEGVKENIFDKEHMEIVKQEVFGLNSIVEKAEKRKRKQPKEAKSVIEKSLIMVRNQRLNDAVTLLQNR